MRCLRICKTRSPLNSVFHGTKVVCQAIFVKKMRRREITFSKEEEASTSSCEPGVSDTQTVRESLRKSKLSNKTLKCLTCDEVTRNKKKWLLCLEISATQQILTRSY